MSISPFVNNLLSGLLGDPEVSALFSVEAELDGMIAFERALAASRRRRERRSRQLRQRSFRAAF
jgi:hypothetical protein